MRNFKKITTTQIKEVGRTCDCCKKSCDNKEELGEWLSYTDTAGYFADHYTDGDKLELDLCEKCKKDLLGDFIRVVGNCF